MIAANGYNGPLKNSALFRWRLNRATHNPLDALIKSDNTDGKGQPENIFSIITGLISFVAAIAGIVAYSYVSSKSKEFSESGNNGTKSINASSLAVLDTHHVCIPPINGTLTLTLPDPTLLNLGRYVSASLPLSIPPESTSDTRTAFVTWNGGSLSYKIAQNKGALFMVSHELSSRKWKLVREWPSDNGYTAGS